MRTPSCPICRKTVEWENNEWRPFCSERCKLIDLGQWASEGYVIEGGMMDDESEEKSIKEENGHG